MNEPIISPWLIYLIGRVDILNGFCFIVGVTATIAVTILTILTLASGSEITSFLKKLFCITLVLDIFAFFVPSKTEVIAMYTATYITPANIKATGEFADKTIDKLIEKVLKASEAINEHKND